MRDSAAGVIDTEATGMAVTVMLDVADFPSMVAVTSVSPGATAVTTPEAPTVATATLLLCQPTVLPET